MLRNLQNTNHPPAEGCQLSCEECDQGDTTVVGLWGKVASGSYHHFRDWVLGRPVYYKTEDHNFTLSVLPNHKAWGFSDQADAKYAYIVASYENGNTGPNSPRDVVRRRQT